MTYLSNITNGNISKDTCGGSCSHSSCNCGRWCSQRNRTRCRGLWEYKHVNEKAPKAPKGRLAEWKESLGFSMLFQKSLKAAPKTPACSLAVKFSQIYKILLTLPFAASQPLCLKASFQQKKLNSIGKKKRTWEICGRGSKKDTTVAVTVKKQADFCPSQILSCSLQLTGSHTFSKQAKYQKCSKQILGRFASV